MDFILAVFDRLKFEIAFILCAVAVEVAVRSRLAKGVATKAFFVDLVYCAFYRFGIFALLIDSPIHRFFDQYLNVQLLGDSPVWLRAMLYLPMLDLGYYVAHRMMHRYPLLWAFHQVHHSQDDMGVLTTYRLHPVDMWLRQFVGPTVFLLMLGLPPSVWFPARSALGHRHQPVARRGGVDLRAARLRLRESGLPLDPPLHRREAPERQLQRRAVDLGQDLRNGPGQSGASGGGRPARVEGEGQLPCPSVGADPGPHPTLPGVEHRPRSHRSSMSRWTSPARTCPALSTRSTPSSRA